MSFEARAGNKAGYPLGPRPGGYIGFNEARFWVMLIDTDRRPPANVSAITDAEAASFLRSSAAYTGLYRFDEAATPDGNKLTIQVDAASNEALSGSERIFYVRVDGNRLFFKAPSVFVPVTGQTTTVELTFVKAD